MLSKYNAIRARRARGEEGFTLIELLVVVVIIGILIAIAIPIYLNYEKSSHDKATGSDARNAVVAMENCYTKNGAYPATTTIGTTTGTNAATSTELGTGGTAPSDCGQKITTSDGTYMVITSTGTAYTLSAYNVQGNGTGASFCYNSANGGTVEQSSTACS